MQLQAQFFGFLFAVCVRENTPVVGLPHGGNRNLTEGSLADCD